MRRNASLEDAWSAALPTAGQHEGDVVARTARRALSRHEQAYTGEVRRLLDAGLEVMRRQGTTKSPRVADIVGHAGLSRDAFYRHFASKEDLVAAVVEAGAWRLVGYARHQMAKAAGPEAEVRVWIRAVMSQAIDPDVAHTTRAVLWNGSHSTAPSGFDYSAALSTLLVAPLTGMGSPDPARDAVTIGHAVMGELRAALQRGAAPGDDDLEHLSGFCLAALQPRSRAAPPAHRSRRIQQ